MKDSIVALELDREEALYTDVDKGHGRIEQREIWTSTEINDYVPFPYVKQVGIIRRTITHVSCDKTTSETVCFVTSLSEEKANAHNLLKINRGHWAIENSSHYVRDVTFKEDNSRIRKRSGPRIMATLRNLVISLLRIAGITNIASGLRYLGWSQRSVVMRMIGIPVVSGK